MQKKKASSSQAKKKNSLLKSTPKGKTSSKLPRKKSVVSSTQSRKAKKSVKKITKVKGKKSSQISAQLPVHVMPEIKMPPPQTRAEFKLCSGCNGFGYLEVDRIVSDPIKTKLRMACLNCHGTGKIKNYFTKKVKEQVLSNQLHKYTKLTKEQLTRLEQQGGNGAHAKFTSDGQLSLELVRRLELAKRRQPKFVIYSNEHGRPLYIADRGIVKVPKEETPLTTDIKEALTFIEGFDDEQKKIDYYGPLTKLKLMSKRV